MPVDRTLQELMDRWEEFQEQGGEVSAQELCREYPELLEELKRRIKALKAMAWLLDDEDSDDDSDGGESGQHSREVPPALGRYRLDRLVGMGGFGQVWKGYDPELQRVVAVKVPRADRLSAEQAAAFVEEARKVARLRHPGIVPVHDVGRDGDYGFIVSDFVEGGSLADRMKKGQADWQETAELVAKVAEILDHAHQHGFVHRDIKPANILLDGHGQPYLTDFGIAVTKEQLGDQTPSIGTLAYMSPEQIAGQPVDARSDIYSLGVVLFEMLTGSRPFTARNPRDLRDQILAASPQIRSQAPAEMERICLKCLQKNPMERYSAASTLATELRGPGIPADQAGRRSHNRPVLFGLALLLLMIAAGVWTFGPARKLQGKPWAENTNVSQEALDALADVTAAANHRLAEVEEALRPAPADAGPEWIDLGPLVQPELDCRDASWKVHGDVAEFSAQKRRAYVSIPLMIDGSYELQTRVTIVRAKETTAIRLPVFGDKAVILDLKGDRRNDEAPTATIRLLGVVNPPVPQGDTGMDVGTEYAFSCKVTLSEDEADIEIRRDGQMLFQWSGDASQVDRHHVLRPGAVELETAYYTISRLTGLRLRMLSDP